jgi:hypothetical protein
VASKKRSLAAKRGWETRRRRAAIKVKARRAEAARRGHINRLARLTNLEPIQVIALRWPWRLTDEEYEQLRPFRERIIPPSPAGLTEKKPPRKASKKLVKKKLDQAIEQAEKVVYDLRIMKDIHAHREEVIAAIAPQILQAKIDGRLHEAIRELWFDFQDFEIFEDEHELWALYEEIG